MPSAICPHCEEEAFSSAEFTQPWTCPTCGERVIPPAFEESRKHLGVGKDPVVELYARYWVYD